MDAGSNSTPHFCFLWTCVLTFTTSLSATYRKGSFDSGKYLTGICSCSSSQRLWICCVIIPFVIVLNFRGPDRAQWKQTFLDVGCVCRLERLKWINWSTDECNIKEATQKSLCEASHHHEHPHQCFLSLLQILVSISVSMEGFWGSCRVFFLSFLQILLCLFSSENNKPLNSLHAWYFMNKNHCKASKHQYLFIYFFYHAWPFSISYFHAKETSGLCAECLHPVTQWHSQSHATPWPGWHESGWQRTRQTLTPLVCAWDPR